MLYNFEIDTPAVLSELYMKLITRETPLTVKMTDSLIADKSRSKLCCFWKVIYQATERFT